MKKEVTMPDFAKLELDMLKFWQANDSFEKLKEKNKKTGKYFRFLDGPITANNKMMVHHTWGRSLKDISLKFHALDGCDAHYQNGFDAQGLWVEVNVEKELGLKDKKDIIKYGIENFTNASIDRVKKYADIITKQSIRLGQWMNWDDSYYTNSDTNITYIWHFLKLCYEKGWLIEKYRPMPWCSHCGTSLSEHELTDSYKDMEHTAVFFKLPITNSNRSVIVWTTTPWTLSSNVAVAVNPELTYVVCKVKSTDRLLIVCKSAIKVLKDDFVSIVEEVKGSELVGLEYTTIFNEFSCQQFNHKIIEWDAVDATEGSGAVHIAPGCGIEDFELGSKLDLPNICPIDESGDFVDGFGFLSGKNANDVADLVFEEMKKRSNLYYTHKYLHRYPICWRCKEPLLFRLSKEWYIKADEIRPQMIATLDSIEWQPDFMKKRMFDWLTNMGDWNISRKRFYGLPLPFYRCPECGELTVVGSLEELAKLSSEEEVKNIPHLHRPFIDKVKVRCPKCGTMVSRVDEVGDCWLDAGIVPFSTLKYFEDHEYWENNFPADLVIEMKEQIRLWFYSMLFMSVAITGKAPYKKVIGFASLVAEDGSKFSKSGPNCIDFDVLVEQKGADVLRYIFASNNMLNDTRFGESICDETRRKLLGLWNSYIFFNTYAVIDKPVLDNYKPKETELTITDKWLISKVNTFVKESKQYYYENKYYLITRDFELLIDEISNWFIRLNRRRFWKSGNTGDKLVAYYCLFYAIKKVCQVMAPILIFETEYIWQNLVCELNSDAEQSIMLAGYPTVDFEVSGGSDIIAQTDIARNIITLGQRLRNENQIKIKQPLQTMFVSGDESLSKTLKTFNTIILSEMNVKEIVFETNTSKFNDKYLTINFREAGKVLKQRVQELKSKLESFSIEEMNKLSIDFENDTLHIEGFDNLPKELFNINLKSKEHYAIASFNNVTICLDITIDKELMLEGVCREFVRQLQIMRKEADFQLDSRIDVSFRTDSDLLREVIQKYRSNILGEILAVEVLDSISNADTKVSLDIEDETICVEMKKR